MQSRTNITNHELMRVGFLGLGIFLLLATIVFPHAARADVPMVEASYRWLSSETTNDGKSSASFSFTISNMGSVDFTGLNLRLHMSPPVPMANPNTEIPIGYLAAGETLTITQSIPFLMPVDGNSAVVFLGEAQDIYNTSISTPVSIETEGVQ